MTDARYGARHLDAWRRDGGVLIENFFTPAEVAAVQADFIKVFGRSGGADEAMVKASDVTTARFNPRQFMGVRPVPVDCSPALNLIGVHPSLIAFAKAALGVDKVHVYQCQAWAKFTGDADYAQPFHCDFPNHTLTVPSASDRPKAITILCYFTDVTEADGPMHYVSRPDSLKVTGPEGTFAQGDEAARIQAALAPYDRSSAGPAGSVFPYSIDVFHRATNLTAPNSRRFALMTCFKPAGEESIGFYAWANHHTDPWDRIFDHATPEQLECFGVPAPGHPFWTPETLRRTKIRRPGWNDEPYRRAM